MLDSPESATLAVTIIPVSRVGGVATPGSASAIAETSRYVVSSTDCSFSLKRRDSLSQLRRNVEVGSAQLARALRSQFGKPAHQACPLVA